MNTKVLGVLLALSVVSTNAFAAAHWTCQCFENVDAAGANRGLDVSANDAPTLKDAEEAALAYCQGENKAITVARCLHVVEVEEQPPLP